MKQASLLGINVRTLEKQYSKGDLVYVLNSGIPKGKSKKLSPVWKGPVIIVVKLSAFYIKLNSGLPS